MATWRIILKKTRLFEKGRISANYGRELKRYLARYVDEVGKAATKGGEGPSERRGEEKEARWLLPEESTGILWSGGFFGEEFSAGMAQSNKQLGWCRNFVNRWIGALEPATRRRNDGFRFIMSLGPKAVEDLTASGISVDQAMRSVWKTTVALYRERHGWTEKGGELGWVAGAHHDTDNAHMHLIVFPTTLDGTPLKTNYRGVGEKKIDDLNDLIAMCNIAAEIFWRDNLGLEYQSREYREKILDNPESEPDLPEIKDFKRAYVEPAKKKREPSPKLGLKAMGREAAEELRLALGAGKPRRRGWSRALRRLRSYVSILETYGEKRSVKLWDMLKLIDKNPEEAVEALEKDFPEETEAMQTLQKELAKGSRKWEKRVAGGWGKRGADWARALLASVLGMPDDPKREHLRETGIKLATGFEKSFKTIPEERLKGVWNVGTGLGKDARRAGRDKARYRAAYLPFKEKSGKDKPGLLTLFRAVIRGAERLKEMLEARRNETRAAIKQGKGKFTLREIEREWSVENGDMVPKKTIGRPWPLHLDPELVFEKLKTEEPAPPPPQIPKKRKTEEIAETMKTGQRAPEESVLEKLARIVRPRSARRRAMARQKIKETPEIE